MLISYVIIFKNYEWENLLGGGSGNSQCQPLPENLHRVVQRLQELDLLLLPWRQNLLPSQRLLGQETAVHGKWHEVEESQLLYILTTYRCRAAACRGGMTAARWPTARCWHTRLPRTSRGGARAASIPTRRIYRRGHPASHSNIGLNCFQSTFWLLHVSIQLPILEERSRKTHRGEVHLSIRTVQSHQAGCQRRSDAAS